MAKLFASWVPGYAAVAQDMSGPPLDWRGQGYSDVNGHREGFGVYFYLQANRSDWFHIPIPTPVIVEDVRASLNRVMVLYEVPEGGALNAVHVWDGPSRILQLDNLTISGSHYNGLEDDNTWDVNRADILWGVGISLLFSCVVNTTIYFGAAGADFYHDI